MIRMMSKRSQPPPGSRFMRIDPPHPTPQTDRPPPSDQGAIWSLEQLDEVTFVERAFRTH